jgi:hypothetical protein
MRLYRGISLFESTDIYGKGESQRIHEHKPRECRGGVARVAKGGRRLTSGQRIASLAKRPVRYLVKRIPVLCDMKAADRARPLPCDYVAAFLRQAPEQRPRRLRTDHFDIYLLHSPSSSQERLFCNARTGQGRRPRSALGPSCNDRSAVDATLLIAGVSNRSATFVLPPTRSSRAATVKEFSARSIGSVGTTAYDLNEAIT